MGLGLSIFLFAVGAILTFAVTVDVGGVSIETVGIILMVVSFVGGILIFAASRRRTIVTRERPVGGEIVREEHRDPGAPM